MPSTTPPQAPGDPRDAGAARRFLERVLGGVEVLAAADQPREHARDEGAQLALVHPSPGLVDHSVSVV